MANFVYDNALHLLGSGSLTLISADLRVLLVEGATDADTLVTALVLSDFALDEHASAGRIALANESWDKDVGNHWSELTADDTVFPSLANEGSVVGAVLYSEVGADSADIPIAFFDTGGFPFTPTGDDNTIVWNASGIMVIKNSA